MVDQIVSLVDHIIINTNGLDGHWLLGYIQASPNILFCLTMANSRSNY